jgi:hypothetical protein
MSDDSFFREVNEELRSDRLKSVWSRFGWIIIATVVLIVGGTAGWRGYEYWQASVASRSGDAFLEALALANAGDTTAALAAFEELRAEGHGSYPVLARMRAATLKAEGGNPAEAIADFRQIGGDGSVPMALQEIARLRAAYLMVDHGTYDEVVAAVSGMAVAENPMRHSAREALGLAAFRAGDMQNANAWFAQIMDDEQAPAGAQQRAEIILDLIAASGGVSEDENPA